jgi:hypothetical protein
MARFLRFEAQLRRDLIEIRSSSPLAPQLHIFSALFSPDGPNRDASCAPRGLGAAAEDLTWSEQAKPRQVVALDICVI